MRSQITGADALQHMIAANCVYLAESDFDVHPRLSTRAGWRVSNSFGWRLVVTPGYVGSDGRRREDVDVAVVNERAQQATVMTADNRMQARALAMRAARLLDDGHDGQDGQKGHRSLGDCTCVGEVLNRLSDHVAQWRHSGSIFPGGASLDDVDCHHLPEADEWNLLRHVDDRACRSGLRTREYLRAWQSPLSGQRPSARACGNAIRGVDDLFHAPADQLPARSLLCTLALWVESGGGGETEMQSRHPMLGTRGPRLEGAPIETGVGTATVPSGERTSDPVGLGMFGTCGAGVEQPVNRTAVAMLRITGYE